MAALKRRHNKWEARVRVPQGVRHREGGSALRYKTLSCGDRRAAKVEADHWEAGLRAEWAALMGHDALALSSIRALYERTRAEVAGWTDGPEVDDAVLAGVDVKIPKLADEVGGGELSPAQAARLAALQDASRDLQRLPVAPRRELEPSFSELADDLSDGGRRSRASNRLRIRSSKSAQPSRCSRATGATDPSETSPARTPLASRMR